MFCSKRNTDLSRSSTRTTDCQHQTISQNKELTIQESRKKNTKHTIHQMNTIMHQLSSYKTSEPRCNEKGDKVSVLSTETQFTHYISHLNQTANVAKYSRSSKTKGSWWNKVGCRFLQEVSLSLLFSQICGRQKKLLLSPQARGCENAESCCSHANTVKTTRVLPWRNSQLLKHP